MTCLLCATNSARTSAMPCCELRQLAISPKHQQAAYAMGLTQNERDELRPRLAAEIARLKSIGNDSLALTQTHQTANAHIGLRGVEQDQKRA